MKLYTTKPAAEGLEIYVSNWIVIIIVLIVIGFGVISINQPQEKIEVSTCK